MEPQVKSAGLLAWLAKDGWCVALTLLMLIQSSRLIGVEQARVRELELSRKMTQLRNPSHYSRDLDPGVGRRLSVLKLESESGKLVDLTADTQRHVIVFSGNCASCVAETLRRWNRVASEKVQVSVVTQSDWSQVRTFKNRYGLKLPFYREQLAPQQMQEYNVGWRPRAYVLDGGGTLIALQQEWEDARTVIRQQFGVELAGG